MIFEWTYNLLLVISSWAWLYSIKADRTTQLHLFGTADSFTTTANLKAHTFNRWQTRYLNWKFDTFCVLDSDIKVLLKWNSFLLYRAEAIWCTFVSCTIRAPNMPLRGRNYLCTKVFLYEPFCWKSSGNLIREPILTSWKVISYSWKKRIEALWIFSIIFELTCFANNEGSVKVHHMMRSFLKSLMRCTLVGGACVLQKSQQDARKIVNQTFELFWSWSIY